MSQHKRLEAKPIINKHILLSVGMGSLPIPLADIAVTTAIQMDMFQQLCALYQKPYSNYLGKSLVGSLAGNTLARVGASFIKFIPGIGSLVGGISMSILSGASTYALGQVFMHYLEKEESLDDMDMEEAKHIYEESLEKGKTHARNLKDQAKKTPDSRHYDDMERDVFEKLRKLSDLRNAGIITEKEFNTKKEEWLGEL